MCRDWRVATVVGSKSLPRLGGQVGVVGWVYIVLPRLGRELKVGLYSTQCVWRALGIVVGLR